MRRGPLALVLATLMAPASALADGGGYQLAKGFGTAGVVSGLAVGPAFTVTGFALGASAIGNAVEEEEEIAANKLGFGAVMMATGFGVTAVAPAVVVTSATLGALSLRDGGSTPSLAAAYIGMAGVGIQLAGVGLLYTRVSNDKTKGNGDATAMRLGGWSLAMIAGGVQMAKNGKANRSSSAANRDHRNVRVALLPSQNGAHLVGRF